MLSNIIMTSTVKSVLPIAAISFEKIKTNPDGPKKYLGGPKLFYLVCRYFNLFTFFENSIIRTLIYKNNI